MDFEGLIGRGVAAPPAEDCLPGAPACICARFWNDLFGRGRRLTDMWARCDGVFLEAARDWSVETMAGGGLDAPLP
ncbi:MAG TPA: hypothetical protein VEB20_19535 [Azospirillaceae bacterium]|nr:hypothetical protein [Azospirillaceae bacterium]